MVENNDTSAEVFEEKLTQYITRTIEKVKRTGNVQRFNLQAINAE
jgi:hypothetical protein